MCAKEKTNSESWEYDMNKKIFGIKIGTYLTVVLCLVLAVTIWLAVKMIPAPTEALMLIGNFR